LFETDIVVESRALAVVKAHTFFTIALLLLLLLLILMLIMILMYVVVVDVDVAKYSMSLLSVIKTIGILSLLLSLKLKKMSKKSTIFFGLTILRKWKNILKKIKVSKILRN
jgi:hypothetical protein